MVTGILGRDATMNTSKSGDIALNFSVCSIAKKRKGEGKETPSGTWLNCTFWISADRPEEGEKVQAPAILKYLKKGTKVFLRGIPGTSVYTLKDVGVKVSLTLRVYELELLAPPKSEGVNNQPSNSISQKYTSADQMEGGSAFDEKEGEGSDFEKLVA